MTFDEWYEREGRHMAAAECSPEAVARAAFFVAWHEARKSHEGRIGFVRGAKWCHATLTGATAFPSEVDVMEAAAFRVYPEAGDRVGDAKEMIAPSNTALCNTNQHGDDMSNRTMLEINHDTTPHGQDEIELSRAADIASEWAGSIPGKDSPLSAEDAAMCGLLSELDDC